MGNGPLDVQPLAGLGVVDLSTWIAGAYSCRLLSDAGAAVTRVEPDGGHPLRTWTASGAASGALFEQLATGQVVESADMLGEVLEAARVCVWSPGGRLDPATIRAEYPHLTVLAITPFGLGTSWSDRPSTEFTLQAWSGGVIGLGRGRPDRPPVHVGGQVGEWLSGAYATVGLLAALRLGGGRLVDVSMLEVQAMCLTYYPVTYHDSFGRPMRKQRALTVPGVAAARDALVGLGVGTGQQWLDFCVMAGHPEWAEDASLFTDRSSLAGAIDEWVGALDSADVLELATAFRIPNAPIIDGESATDAQHFIERGNYSAEDDRVVIRSPLRFTPGPEGSTGTDFGAPGSRAGESPGALPFSGLRVLDMTAYWAGPSASHMLAMLGAEVIHLESARRPDGARLVGGRPATTEQYWEQGPIYAAINTNKKGLTLDFTTPEGLDLLRRFIATCDVVIENYTPRVLDSLGLSGDALRELRDDLIVVRMPGFGLDGPWRDQPAFAFVIEDASGLTWLTGHADQHPVEPYCVGDSNAGVHAALGLMLALAHRDGTGSGCHVEAAMIDAALSITREQVVEFAASGIRLERDGNRGPVGAPQNLYQCAGLDEFDREPARVAIAVTTDEQWASLRQAMGSPNWAADPSMSTAAGRRVAQDEIDAMLGEWCSSRSVSDVAEQLAAAGVPVAVVQQPHRQVDLPPLQERSFFERVDHPVMGTARYSTLPFRIEGIEGPRHRRHAPLLGEHNAELLTELGLSMAEIDKLEANGVIAGSLDGLSERMRHR